MQSSTTGQLVGSEIHGFHTLQELDVGNMMEEAKSRWLRPNEILAVLCNYKYFTINAKPVNLPKSGTIVLFDRKMLRNFRKDGHNWKKKNDGKTVKEAHEHLKVGNEERIHVYYAHGQDNSTFVRRCYWLLDKSLEHIVLVHYRDTEHETKYSDEAASALPLGLAFLHIGHLQGSPVRQVNSSSSSHSGPTAPGFISEEFDSGAENTPFTGEKETLEITEAHENLSIRNYHQRLHEINTLEWDELLSANDPNNSAAVRGGKVDSFETQKQIVPGGPGNRSPPVDDMCNPKYGSNYICDFPESVCTETVFDQEAPEFQSVGPLATLLNDGLQSQDSLGTWINNITVESPCCTETTLEPSVSNDTYSSLGIENHQLSLPEQIFHVTDISPVWAYTMENTKVLITGLLCQEYLNLSKSNLFCVCGDARIPVETVQVGVYRCVLPPHSPGFVNFYLSLDGHKPISQVLNFEYRTPVTLDPLTSVEDKNKWDDFRLQMRLAKLVFTKSKNLDIMSTNLSSTAIEKARMFALRTNYISNRWDSFMNSTVECKIALTQAKDGLFELTLKNRLKEWLLERIGLDYRITEHDSQGQGVIHLCAILGYTWAINLYSWSGFSLDFRDKHGWTALHWAAYLGREKMVAVLLSAGAKPNLVTDPTSRNPGGYTAADLAYMKGYDGLAAYLSEKALVEQFKDMSIAGNISGLLKTSTTYTVDSSNLTEDELFLKDTLAAYRITAEAAGRIQSAFRERSFKLRAKAVEILNTEDEARSIVAAMKIQHAFRNYESRKMLAAAAHIQYRFRSWKLRKEFLNMRRQAIKIQAAFRGFQVRKQYRKILWSVGVLEKVILRWRLKRRGFRGLQVNTAEAVEEHKQESDTEEDFFRASRKQAEERVERSVVRVQAMFRSRKAQEEYRRMKLAHNQAKLKYEELIGPEMEIEM